jgi:membrane-associated phospholipid phosphatase
MRHVAAIMTVPSPAPSATARSERRVVVTDGPDYARLARRSAAAVVAGAALVAACYFFVDRRVAFLVHDHPLAIDPVLRDLTYPPPILQAWAPAVLAALLVRRAWGPFRRWEAVVLSAAAGLVLADQFRESLSYLLGRYWPDTWIDNNPSLIKDGAYGFHPFHGGSAYGSCPSGHTARTAAAIAPAWVAYPRWRWLCALAVAVEGTALVGMNYHFVGDVVAGAVVGGVVGAYAAAGCGVGPARP